MLVLDHLAVVCTSLDEGTAWVEDRLGVKLQKGGAHPLYATHNMLLGLAGGIYLEVIAKDPNAIAQAGHSWFGLDDFTGPARLTNWICQVDRIIDAPPVVGPMQSLTRGDLAWQITVPQGGGLPYDGAFPTLIKWGANTVHPAKTLSPSGCSLHSFDIQHPKADIIAAMINMNDPRITLSKGPFAMQASFDTPHGIRTL